MVQYSIRDKFVLAAIPEEYAPEPEHLNLLIHSAMVKGIEQSIENLQKNLQSSSLQNNKDDEIEI